MSNTNKSKRQDTILRGCQALERLWEVEESGFRKKVKQIQTKWNLPRWRLKSLLLENRNIPDEEIIERSRRKIFIEADRTFKRTMDFFRGLNKRNRLSEFIKDIAHLLDDFELGLEWIQPIAELVITGFCIPPAYNFEVCCGKNRIFIVLNPNTSKRDVIEGRSALNKFKNLFYQNRKQPLRIITEFVYTKDPSLHIKTPFNFEVGIWEGFIIIFLNQTTTIENILKGWHLIKEFQKRFYSKTKKPHLKPTLWRNLKLYKKDRKLSKKIEVVENENTGELEKYKKSSLDKIADLFPNVEDYSLEADIRRRNLIRQVRKRLKQKETIFE